MPIFNVQVKKTPKSAKILLMADKGTFLNLKLFPKFRYQNRTKEPNNNPKTKLFSKIHL